ncbi:HAMP domain-containing sensor histidine kinase [Dyella sp. OK004]|uniref:sensor histidine kinase n=1 Tax=Dyella sp. OK004 TaxID=1855292 RepID=UPI000B869A62|nr:HAMP domain-containing sensor histidine kinase [Dyella sp. OK004]
MSMLAGFRHSVVFRMAAGYGLLLLLSVGVVSAIFYVGTAGLLARNIDKQLSLTSRRLIQLHDHQGIAALQQEVHTLLTDDQDVNTEIYQLTAADGRQLVGNLTAWTWPVGESDARVERHVRRLGRDTLARLLIHRFPDGAVLVVGRDLQDQRDLERMILTALAAGGLIALVLAAGGALLFRAQLQRQLQAIHRTTSEVAAGQLDRRIAVGRSRDEFAVVANDVNRMLDEIERLMDTARNVSNAIAHDLRTPLGRIRAALEDALRSQHPLDRLQGSAQYAIDEIDTLITLFDKLLQIAEAESGLRRQRFDVLPLREVVGDIVELYQPAAENEGMNLSLSIDGEPTVSADRDLLASIMANLLDNALKYAGHGASVQVAVRGNQDHVHIEVTDNGPGIPPHAIERATERFFRLDASRHLRGNGLGLSIVAAVVALHHGTLALEDARPGLRVVIALPRS